MNKYGAAFATALLGIAACHKTQAPQAYEAVPVQRRNIVVSASASGAIEPVLTVDVKSKASGEIIAMNDEVGDDAGEPLAEGHGRSGCNTMCWPGCTANISAALPRLIAIERFRYESS